MPPLKVRHYEEKVVFEIIGAFSGNYSHTNWNSSVKYQPSFFLWLVTKVTKESLASYANCPEGFPTKFGVTKKNCLWRTFRHQYNRYSACVSEMKLASS